MNKNHALVSRRHQPQLRRFVRFEFAVYILLHAYTCYVILADYGVLFAVISVLSPIIPELYLFVMAIYTKNMMYLSVFLIFVVLVAINFIASNVKNSSK